MSAPPFRIQQRGEAEVDVMRVAMLNELACNAHKGPWEEIDAATAVHEILYHTAKLALALREGDHPEAVLEYTADVALGAMFAASASGSLEEQFVRPGHAEDHDAPWRWELPRWKRRTRALARELVGEPRRRSAGSAMRGLERVALSILSPARPRRS